jgi:Sec-independent protein translocase protein TatA
MDTTTLLIIILLVLVLFGSAGMGDAAGAGADVIELHAAPSASG